MCLQQAHMTLAGIVMIGVKPGARASAFEQRTVVSFSRRRRRLHSSPMTRTGVTTPVGSAVTTVEPSVSEALLDEEFDELGCELSTLLRVAIQL
jgi:hypothetical protein